MIVDVHCHAWNDPEHFSPEFLRQAARARGGAAADLTVRYADYRQAAPAGIRTVVFGGKARLSGLWVDDRHVADFVAAHGPDLIGFLSVDPTVEGWEEELRAGHQGLGLRGIKLLPMYAGFSPDEMRLEPLWRYAESHGLPVLLHVGTTFVGQAPLACTLPRLVDPVAIRHPELRLVLAHLGHPYEAETVAVIRKHPHVYADVSALHPRPFQLYQSLMLVQEYGVWEKLLFGSDYPFTTVAASLEGLRGLNRMLEGTGLPRLREGEIERLIHRKSLALLGLA